MKLNMEHYDFKVNLEKENDDLDIFAVVSELIVPALLSLGFSMQSICDAFQDQLETEGRCDECHEEMCEDCEHTVEAKPWGVDEPDDDPCVCGDDNCGCKEKGYGYYEVGGTD